VSIPAYRFPKDRAPLIHKLKLCAARISETIAANETDNPRGGSTRPYTRVVASEPSVPQAL
jgi:hypothetical protein